MEEFFELLSKPTYVFWLVTGVVFVLMEVILAPGIGFLFAGLGALTLGCLIAFNFMLVEGWTWQFAFFFFLTTVWAIILWVPLKNAIRNKKGEGYKDIVGTIAIVDDEIITKDKVSHVKWNGARMRARIAPYSNIESIAKGEQVWIHESKSGILYVDSNESK